MKPPKMMLIFFLLKAFTFTANAGTLPPYCVNPEFNMREITVRVLPDNHDKNIDSVNWIKYRYRYLDSFDPSLPTVLHIPGGPGGTSMEMGVMKFDSKIKLFYEHLKGKANVLLTDPRGVGCNADTRGPFSPKKFYSTDQFANDLIEVIKAENLKNYIVYGHSYGTYLGTRLVNRLEAEHSGHLPSKLLLIGVLGPPRTEKRGDQEIHDQKIEAERLFQELLDSQDPSVAASYKEYRELFLEASKKSNPLAYLDHQVIKNPAVRELISFEREPSFSIGSGIDAIVKAGGATTEKKTPRREVYDVLDPDVLREYLSDQYLDRARALLKFLSGENILRGLFSNLVPKSYRKDVFEWIYPRAGTKMHFVSGVRVAAQPAGNDFAKFGFSAEQVRLFNVVADEVFVSRSVLNFPIVYVPTVFVQGTHDIRTSYESAKVHFEGQPRDGKVFITIEGGAHTPTQQLYILGCDDKFWSAIVDNNINTETGYQEVFDQSCTRGKEDVLDRLEGLHPKYTRQELEKNLIEENIYNYSVRGME